jgi:rare lipoprotein A
MPLLPRASLTLRAATLLMLGSLAACASHGPENGNAPREGAGYYKVGKPYQINGVWYYPHEDYSYDETGIASWYGADFHEKATANGEIFNKNELTAAHATLPLPTLARVTNLENGRSIVVRINDRGPFSGARIIDVTQRAAQLLGFENQGTAKVRVQVLADESKAIADAMRRYGSPASNPSGTQPAQETAIAEAAPVGSVTAQALDPPQGYHASQAPLAASQQQVAQPQQQALPPLPATKAEAHAMMATIKPVAEARQLPVTGNHQIYIQAGAFSKVENANKMKQHLAKFAKATVVEAVVNGTHFYRVRVGPSPSVVEADKLLKKIIRAGAENARIVVD